MSTNISPLHGKPRLAPWDVMRDMPIQVFYGGRWRKATTIMQLQAWVTSSRSKKKADQQMLSGWEVMLSDGEVVLIYEPCMAALAPDGTLSGVAKKAPATKRKTAPKRKTARAR